MRAAARAFWTNQQGDALVELALVVGLLGVPLLLGAGTVSTLAFSAIGVENAAHVGAQYGAQSTTTAVDTSGMIQAAQVEAADITSSLTVVPLMYYACATSINGTQYTGNNAQANAQAACTGNNNHAVQFVQVVASLAVTPGIRCPGLPATWNLSSTSTMEVQQ